MAGSGGGLEKQVCTFSAAGVSYRCVVSSRANGRHTHGGRGQGQLQGLESSMSLQAAVGTLAVSVHSYDCRVSPQIHAFQWRLVSGVGLGACRYTVALASYR